MTRSVDRIPEQSMTRWVDDYDTQQARKEQLKLDKEQLKKEQYKKEIWECASKMMSEKRQKSQLLLQKDKELVEKAMKQDELSL